MLNVVWFKRDLRIEDHRPLFNAAERGAVLAVYIVEPDYWRLEDSSARQWDFVRDCLSELQTALRTRGSELFVLQMDTVAALDLIRARFGDFTLWSHEETGNAWTYARDKRVAAWTKGHQTPWHEITQTGVVRRLGSRNGWASHWDRVMAEPITPAPKSIPTPPCDLPTHIPSAHELRLASDPCPERQSGGREVALRTLDSFLHVRGRNYRFEMSSPVTAFDASSRLSPHLTWGTLSMREAAQATWRRLNEIEPSPATKAWRNSLTSFSGRLHWHCHFIQKLEDDPAIEFANMHSAYNGLRPETGDPERLAAFMEGRTGNPFVDACLRALEQHGWLNFRMRAMLMSFASYHLWLPWRESGLFLARRFVDYEPGIHWPQVQMQSGTTGMNTVRIYNPIKQSYDHDPQGVFIRRYVPELDRVPDAFVHEPWKWGERTSYPTPIVDHAAATKAARDAVYAIRKASKHSEETARVIAKHASRKSTPRRKSSKSVDPAQLSLKF